MCNQCASIYMLILIVNFIMIICQPIRNNCSSSARTNIYDRINPYLDISWLEYLHHVYGDSLPMYINKDNINFINKNISVYIKLMFLDESLKERSQSYTFRNHNIKKHIQSNSWNEVIRYSISSIWKDFSSEGYTAPNWTGNFIHHKYINPTKVPYGCWFYPVTGSGIYINVGKILVINKKHSNELSLINPNFNMHTHCMYNDSAVTCYDKYVCSAAINKGFDSIQVLETNELIICSGKCATEEVKGSCPPIDLRTGGGGYYHYPTTKPTTTTTTTVVSAITTSTIAELEKCNCSEELHILNCVKNKISTKSYSSSSSNDTTSINKTLAYRPVACIAVGNSDIVGNMQQYANDFNIMIIFSPIVATTAAMVSSEDVLDIVRTTISSSQNNSSKSYNMHISDIINQHNALFTYLNIDVSTKALYLHINLADKKGKYSFPNYHYPNSIEANNLQYTWLQRNKTNAIAIHFNYSYSNVSSIILHFKTSIVDNNALVWNRIGFIIYYIQKNVYEYNGIDIKLLSRQIIDEAMCLHTSDVNLIVLLTKHSDSNSYTTITSYFYSQVISYISSYIDIWITVHDDINFDITNCSTLDDDTIIAGNDSNETFMLYTSSYQSSILNSLSIEKMKNKMNIKKNIYYIKS